MLKDILESQMVVERKLLLHVLDLKWFRSTSCLDASCVAVNDVHRHISVCGVRSAGGRSVDILFWHHELQRGRKASVGHVSAVWTIIVLYFVNMTNCCRCSSRARCRSAD